MANLIKRIRNEFRMKGMRRELSGLTDGQLDDLGIHRGQITDLTRYCHGLGPRPDSV